MSNVLTPLTPAQFNDYLKDAVPAYAADKIRAGQWAESEAQQRARLSFQQLLPNGVHTPGHRLYAIRNPGTQEAVGMIWIAIEDRAAQRIAYVYDVIIAPEHRRQGHGTRAFQALEAEVRVLGLAGIALHVFGHNTRAHALYVKLGYLPTNINMYKALT